MSVKGEFSRILGTYLELLDAAEGTSARDCASSLRAIHDELGAASGGHALERAAREVLQQARPGGAIARVELRRASQRERFAEATDHLLSLCRAVAGREDA